MTIKHYDITAVIYDKRGKVLSIGKNSYIKTHPMQAKYATQQGADYKIYLHAEIHALVKCKQLERAHSIFVSRFDAAGIPRLAKPCPCCLSAIKAAGIRHITFT